MVVSLRICGEKIIDKCRECFRQNQGPFKYMTKVTNGMYCVQVLQCIIYIDNIVLNKVVFESFFVIFIIKIMILLINLFIIEVVRVVADDVVVVVVVTVAAALLLLILVLLFFAAFIVFVDVGVVVVVCAGVVVTFIQTFLRD